jgi:hypothetical protein
MTLILRDIAARYNVADSTLRKWIEEGVLGDAKALPSKVLHGKKTQVLEHENEIKLDRFLRLRQFFVLNDRRCKLDYDACLAVQRGIECGDLQVGIDTLSQAIDLLEEILESTKLHYQSLCAEKNGEDPIDPLTDVLDE